ncbi:MAG: hypothetical protein ACOC6P_04455 [Candidatus Aminicenantaceae bacterium]
MRLKTLCLVVFILVFSVSLANSAIKDKIFLKDGQILTGSLINPKFKFNTIYGNVEVPNAAARKIERQEENIEVLETVNDEIITGYIANEYLELKISGGPKINVRKELINKIIFSPREEMETKKDDYFMMKNGDVFYGEVLDYSFEFSTSYGTVNTAFSSLLKLEDVEGQTKMYLADDWIRGSHRAIFTFFNRLN